MELIKGAHDAYCNYFNPSKIIEQALIKPTQYNNGIIMRANDRTYRERTKSSDVLDRILHGNDIDVLPRNNYPVFFGSMSTTDIYMRNEMSLYQAIVLKNKDKAITRNDIKNIREDIKDEYKDKIPKDILTVKMKDKTSDGHPLYLLNLSKEIPIKSAGCTDIDPIECYRDITTENEIKKDVPNNNEEIKFYKLPLNECLMDTITSRMMPYIKKHEEWSKSIDEGFGTEKDQTEYDDDTNNLLTPFNISNADFLSIKNN